MKTRLFSSTIVGFTALCLAHALPAAVTVLTVPFDPNNPTTPHNTYPVSSTTEATIILVATAPSAVGSSDKFTVDWSFGDGSADATFALTNPYDISTTHQYPASASTGKQWTAVVTVTDTTANTSGSANYYVIQEPNNLSSRVNVAIDWGLAYMHRTMWRNGTNPNVSIAGGWDTQNYNCTAVNGAAYDCDYYGVIDAENVQALEVNGHLASGPSTDPYTDDVARGLARMFVFLASESTSTDVFNFNPATATYTCADGTYPTTTAPTCAGHGGQHFYNPSATSCTSPPCTFTFDGNSNGKMVYSNDGSGEYTYTTSPFAEALISSGTPNATAPTGPAGIAGQTYMNIVQDIADFYAYSTYGYDYDVIEGYPRGYNYAGGAWLYGPQQGDDNSTSQWAAIGLITANRGFGLSIPAILTDANNTWITNSQTVQYSAPTGPDQPNTNGSYGYRGSYYYSQGWGPFADTASGMVQMALDGVGRTTNTAFGDGSTAFDQRWNNSETYFADNFCNATSGGATAAPRNYIYGLYSFTKSMLLHNVGGVLAPIQYLRTQTKNVFTGDSGVPANTIDWYAALSAANGGTDPCDGVAQTLVGYQLTPPVGSFDGHWYGNNYDSEGQDNFETAWALIMLQKTVIGCSVTGLTGAGAAAGAAPARIDLSWSNETSSTSYNVLRGTTNGGPYSLIGTSMNTSYSDTSGLTNGDTYYYVVQPVNGTVAVCQSSQATITVPKPATGRH